MKVDVESDEFALLLDVSGTLFGNQDRLLVAAAVADADAADLWCQALAKETGIADARVGPQLKRFARAGLLTELPRVEGDRRIFYLRHDSAFWEMAVRVRDEVLSR